MRVRGIAEEVRSKKWWEERWLMTRRESKIVHLKNNTHCWRSVEYFAQAYKVLVNPERRMRGK